MTCTQGRLFQLEANGQRTSLKAPYLPLSPTMANVVHPPLNFFHEPTHLSTSRFGFGFGLSGNPPTGTGKQPLYTPGHTQPSAFQQLTSHINLPAASHRVQKRRLESEDDAESSRHVGRDVPMDRSPTPERPKRAALKRARVTSQDDESKDQQSSRTSKNVDSDSDVDVGVLLGMKGPADPSISTSNKAMDSESSIPGTFTSSEFIDKRPTVT